MEFVQALERKDFKTIRSYISDNMTGVAPGPEGSGEARGQDLHERQPSGSGARRRQDLGDGLLRIAGAIGYEDRSSAIAAGVSAIRSSAGIPVNWSME